MALTTNAFCKRLCYGFHFLIALGLRCIEDTNFHANSLETATDRTAAAGSQ
ncbi:hypothetical protein SDC9_153974 [bioreactor metagenome]|uniref:Uncharacterized protein n=1 Tax=bioreactor metagenome TaxID=1076179 RepID=A0A645EXE4_9ZZZZ